MRALLIAALGLSCGLAAGRSGDERPGVGATICVDVTQDGGRVSRYLTGACIEDVNHEIYGGLYSQMLFGESFQEPSDRSPVQGFRAEDGQWRLTNGELWAEDGTNGPKLVSESPPFADGTVAVDV